jgi:hypothetical protein
VVAQPAGLLFSKDHEWVKFDGDVATIGITDYAQSSLGDIVYVELPRVGATLTAVRKYRRRRIGQSRFGYLHAARRRSRRRSKAIRRWSTANRSTAAGSTK